MVVWMFAACSPQLDGIEPMLESDVQQTARVLEEVGVQPTTVSECFAGPGDCTACFEAVGTPTAGTFTFGVETTPCGTSFPAEREGQTYQIDSSDFDGSWELGVGGTVVELSGSRTASVSGSRDRVDGPPAVLDVASSSLEIDLQGEVEAFALLATYTGLGGRSYAVELTEVAGVLEGSATSAAVSCTIGGTREDPLVDCER